MIATEVPSWDEKHWTPVLTNVYQIAPEVLESIAQYIEQRGLRTPISQVVGFQQFNAIPATSIAAAEGTSSATYVDLATVGPSLSTLGNGKYLLLFGARFSGGSTQARGRMSVSINGATALDANGLLGGGPDDVTNALPPTSLMLALPVTLSASPNSVVAKYRQDQGGANLAEFSQRWLVALRYGNVGS
jgi:hypothetical protein